MRRHARLRHRMDWSRADATVPPEFDMSSVAAFPPRAAGESVQPVMRRLFVRDLIVTGEIGVHPHEKGRRQRVRINLDLDVEEGAGVAEDRLADVVCYEDIVVKVRALVGQRHVNLVETLAERIAEICLGDRRVRRAQVRVEKLDVFEDVASVGVEISRQNPRN